MRLWSVKVFTEGISILWCNCDIERELHNWQGLTRGHISVCYSSVHFQYKGPVMKRIFPCHDIIILKINCTIGRGWLGAYANMSSLCANEREPGSAVGNKEWWKRKPTFGWYASFDVLPQISVRNLFCVWYIPQNIDIVSEMEMFSFWCLFTAPDIVKMTHYSEVIMVAASQITSLTIVFSIVYSDTDQRKHQSSASLAFVGEIHRGPVNSLHKWPVTWKMFPFDDVIMNFHCNGSWEFPPMMWFHCDALFYMLLPNLRGFVWSMHLPNIIQGYFILCMIVPVPVK